MFSQWFLFVCGFLMLADPAPGNCESVGSEGLETPESIMYVQPDVQYGWQVTSVNVVTYEIAQN